MQQDQNEEQAEEEKQLLSLEKSENAPENGVDTLLEPNGPCLHDSIHE